MLSEDPSVAGRGQPTLARRRLFQLTCCNSRGMLRTIHRQVDSRPLDHPPVIPSCCRPLASPPRLHRRPRPDRQSCSSCWCWRLPYSCEQPPRFPIQLPWPSIRPDWEPCPRRVPSPPPYPSRCPTSSRGWNLTHYSTLSPPLELGRGHQGLGHRLQSTAL